MIKLDPDALGVLQDAFMETFGDALNQISKDAKGIERLNLKTDIAIKLAGNAMHHPSTNMLSSVVARFAWNTAEEILSCNDAELNETITTAYTNTKSAFQERRLLEIVRRFMEENSVTCEETIFQTDRVQENATTLIAALCGVVGYPVGEEDENEDEAMVTGV